MAERRRSQRVRTLRAGRIVINNRRSVLDCMVRNLSPAGACLIVPSIVGIPPTFELLIEGERAPRPCKLIWHDQNRIGIEFRRVSG
jgi:PilZ domain